jgi:hypothetical protein
MGVFYWGGNKAKAKFSKILSCSFAFGEDLRGCENTLLGTKCRRRTIFTLKTLRGKIVRQNFYNSVIRTVIVAKYKVNCNLHISNAF